MSDQPFQFLFNLLVAIFSVFSFCICLYLAAILGKRSRREILLAEIIRTYCEIREFSFKYRMFLQKFSSSPYYKVLGSLPSDLQRIFLNTDQIFLEAFNSSEYQKLLYAQKTLKAFCSQIHSIMAQTESRIKTVKL
jgi:hypothetical protein